MGRTFLSVRQGANEIAGRWERASRKTRYPKDMAKLVKTYASEGFMGCNDPLESALFSAMMEMVKRYQKIPDNPVQDE